MTKRTLLGAAMPFAHLLGLSARAEEDDEKSKGTKSRRAEDDPDDKPDAEEEDDNPKGRKAKGRRAEDDPDDDPDAEEDEEEEEEEEDGQPKGRKAKGRRAEDDPDAEEDEEDEKPSSKAVAADRRRCAAIVAHGLKLGSVEQACIFAFDTNMSRDSAIAALSAGSRADGRRGGLRDRMGAGRVNPVGDDDGGKAPNGMTETASAIVRAAERAQGKH